MRKLMLLLRGQGTAYGVLDNHALAEGYRDHPLTDVALVRKALIDRLEQLGNPRLPIRSGIE